MSQTPLTDAYLDELVKRMRADAAMNLELPIVSHLQNTGRLENEAASAIESLRLYIALYRNK